MQGHIRKRGKRKDGTWRWEARHPDPVRGGTHKIERTFRTKQEAEAWLVAEAASRQQGTWVNPREAERPFRDIVQAWKESWPNRLEPKTAERYDSILRVYLLPEFGGTPIGRITHEAVQRYVNRLCADGKAAGTVRNIYAVLRNAMSKGVRLGLVKVNPCTNVDLPRSSREEMLFLTAEEVRALAEAIDPWHRVIVYTAAYTGLRSGELLALRWSDVDLLRGVLHVRRALKDVNGSLEFGPTKTHNTRTVSLPRFLRDMLEEHMATVPAGPDELVFPSRTGKPLRHNLFYRRHFKPAARATLAATKHGLRFHDLRHTCASLSIAAGAHPKLISARLGHSSITITLDRYGHLFPSVEEALAEQLDAAFSAAPAPAPTANVAALRPGRVAGNYSKRGTPVAHVAVSTARAPGV